MAAEIAPRWSVGTSSAIVAVRPAIAAYMPSCATSQAPATAVHDPAAPVSSSPPTYPATPPATQTRRRPQRLRVRSQSAPNSGSATSAASPATPLTSPKSRTLWAWSASASWSGSSSWTGASWAAHRPSQIRANRAVQARPTGTVGTASAATPGAGTPISGASGSRAQHALQVGVGEDAGRVEPVPEGHELLEPRVPRPQHVGVETVQLPPVRPSADLARDRLQRREPRPRIGSRGNLRGDVGAPPPRRRRQRDVVGRGAADLDRERGPPVVGLVHPAQL